MGHDHAFRGQHGQELSVGATSHDDFVGAELEHPSLDDRELVAHFDARRLDFKALKGARNPDLAYRLRIAMLANGVDIMGAPGGLVSATHGAEEVARTLEAFRTSVRWMKAEGDV